MTFDTYAQRLVNDLKQNKPDLTYLETPCLTDQEKRDVFAALSGNTTVFELNCSWCRIDDEMAGVIAQMLLKNCTITRLNISNNMIGNKGIIEICNSLSSTESRGLQSLFTSGNKFGSRGCRKLAEYIQTQGSTLTHIDSLTSIPSTEGCRSLGQAIMVLKPLHIVNNGGEGEKELNAFNFMLKKGESSIKHIEIRYISSNTNGKLKKVFDMLPNMKQLETLELDHIDFNKNPSAFDTFLRNIGRCSQLKTLQVHHSLSVEEMAELCDALKSNQTIKTLDIGYNDFGTHGKDVTENSLIELYKLIVDNIYIETLVLTCCNFGPQEFVVITDALRHRCVDINIVLSSNHPDNATLCEIGKVLNDKPCVKTIDLSCCNITDVGACNMFCGIQNRVFDLNIILKNNRIGCAGIMQASFMILLIKNSGVINVDFEGNRDYATDTIDRLCELSPLPMLDESQDALLRANKIQRIGDVPVTCSSSDVQLCPVEDVHVGNKRQLTSV